MFIEKELERFRSMSVKMQRTSTQWSQMTQTQDTSTTRVVDLLYICPGSPEYPTPVYFLVISDGQRFAVGIATKAVVMQSGHFDPEFQTTRSAVIEYTEFVVANKVTMSQAFAAYISRVNGAFIVLQITNMSLQGRGPLLPHPPGKIEYPPSSSVDTEQEIHSSDEFQGSMIEDHEVKAAPMSFVAERQARFMSVDDSDDEANARPSSCILL